MFSIFLSSPHKKHYLVKSDKLITLPNDISKFSDKVGYVDPLTKVLMYGRSLLSNDKKDLLAPLVAALNEKVLNVSIASLENSSIISSSLANNDSTEFEPGSLIKCANTSTSIVLPSSEESFNCGFIKESTSTPDDKVKEPINKLTIKSDVPLKHPAVLRDCGFIKESTPTPNDKVKEPINKLTIKSDVTLKHPAVLHENSIEFYKQQDSGKNIEILVQDGVSPNEIAEFLIKEKENFGKEKNTAIPSPSTCKDNIAANIDDRIMSQSSPPIESLEKCGFNNEIDNSEKAEQTSKKSLKYKNVYPRNKYPCYYCGKFVCDLSRHYHNKHIDEAIVKEIEAIKVQNKKRVKGEKMDENQRMRMDLYDFLRKSARMNHNLKVQSEKDFLSSRRSNKSREITNNRYIICKLCNGTYVKDYYPKHFKKCNKDDTLTLKELKLASKALIAKLPTQINNYFSKVLLRLREGEVKDIIINDPTIIDFGNAYSYKYRNNEHQDKMIRSRVRTCATFMLALMDVSHGEITRFSDLFVPDNFDYLFAAINIVGKYNVDTDLYDTPATAAAAGAYTKELCDLFITNCIKTRNKVAKEDALEFLQLYATQYPKYISKTIAESQVEQQRMKVIKLPTAKDMQLFYNNLIEKRNYLVNYLDTNDYDYAVWKELGEVLSIILVMFSNRRVGEAERLKRTHYKLIEKLDLNNEDTLALSEEDRNYLMNFRRVLIKGKLNRTVPLIMTGEDEKAIDVYMSFYDEAHVHKSNPYVLALPGYMYNHQNACANIRKYTKLIKGLEYPDRLRGTMFRKNVSTLVLSLKLSKGARTDIYDHLGHAEEINKNIYAQKTFQTQILSVAPILEKAVTRYPNLPDDNHESDNDYDEHEKVTNLPQNLVAAEMKKVQNRGHVTESDQDNGVVDNDVPQIPTSSNQQKTFPRRVKKRLRFSEPAMEDVPEESDEEFKPELRLKKRKTDEQYSPESSADETESEYDYETVNNKKSKGLIPSERKPWSKPERDAVKQFHERYIAGEKISKKEIEDVITTTPSLKDSKRSVTQVRSYLSAYKKKHLIEKNQKQNEGETSFDRSLRNNTSVQILHYFKESIENNKPPTDYELFQALKSPTFSKFTLLGLKKAVNETAKKHLLNTEE